VPLCLCIERFFCQWAIGYGGIEPLVKIHLASVVESLRCRLTRAGSGLKNIIICGGNGSNRLVNGIISHPSPFIAVDASSGCLGAPDWYESASCAVIPIALNWPLLPSYFTVFIA
jgi:hypothetical protein